MIKAMLQMYCRAHHHAENAPLCTECADLHAYARRRLERCVFGEAKPFITALQSRLRRA